MSPPLLSHPSPETFKRSRSCKSNWKIKFFLKRITWQYFCFWPCHHPCWSHPSPERSRGLEAAGQKQKQKNSQVISPHTGEDTRQRVFTRHYCFLSWDQEFGRIVIYVLCCCLTEKCRKIQFEQGTNSCNLFSVHFQRLQREGSPSPPQSFQVCQPRPPWWGRNCTFCSGTL